jgi:hypothetical protein
LCGIECSSLLPFTRGKNRSKIKIIAKPIKLIPIKVKLPKAFPPYDMIRLVTALRKGGNPLRTAPQFWTLTNLVILYHKIIEQKRPYCFSPDRCKGADKTLLFFVPF